VRELFRAGRLARNLRHFCHGTVADNPQSPAMIWHFRWHYGSEMLLGAFGLAAVRVGIDGVCNLGRVWR
jgi:hypothetical protein